MELPAQMGQLTCLKELHVRRNQIRAFPASMARLHLYTFSGMVPAISIIHAYRAWTVIVGSHIGRYQERDTYKWRAATLHLNCKLSFCTQWMMLFVLMLFG